MKSTNVAASAAPSIRASDGHREFPLSVDDDPDDVASVCMSASTTSATNPSAQGAKLHKKTKASKPPAATEDGEEGQQALSRCLVYCRLRPTIRKDFKEGGHALVTLEDRRVVVKDERHYDYDGTFGPSAEQSDVFDAVAVPCIDHAFCGFCSALMCYGQTGTGKSFTMCNTDPQQLGIIPRAAKFIFDKIRTDETRDPTRVYTVVGQFVQIYRDHLGDLMVHDGKDRVEIHHDDLAGVSLTGCSSHLLTSSKDFMRFYLEGNARRVVGSTAMNAESSRGHTAMVVHVSSEDPNDPGKGKLRGKITFVDLAGYERFSKTGITNADPIRKDEAKTINASLLALGHVVSSLSAGTKHVPWRNAKLTRILQDSIGGRSRTSIILTVGPSSEHLYETTNTLQFGLRAMAVKVEAKVSVTVDYVKLSKKLMGLLSERDERISSLEVQIANRDVERQELLARYQRDRGDLEQRFTNELEHLTSTGASEQQIRNLKEVYQAEIENLQDQQQEEIGYQDEIHSKEITQLIKEQKLQEAKSLMEMKLARERLVDEFQQKLDSARGGTNEDLVRALQQLAEKDAILASRANDTARLHATIEALTSQVRALGGVASVEVDFPETFLDVSQVEEMRTRLQGEVDRHYNKLVDLRTQLDRASMLAHDRMEEVTRLQQEAERLHERLLQAGVEMHTSNEELLTLREKRAELVDPEELESLRLLMQSDIDELRSQRDDLQAELNRVNEARIREAVARRRTTMDGPEALKRILAEDPETEGRAGSVGGSTADLLGSEVSELKGSGKTKAMQSAYKKMIQKLNRQLADSSRERGGLVQRIQQLERTLASFGIPVQGGSGGVEEMQQGIGRASGVFAAGGRATPDRDSSSSESRGEEALLTTGNAEVALILLLKEQEMDVRDDLIARLDGQVTRAVAALQQSMKHVAELEAQLRDAGETPVEPPSRPPPVECVALEEYAKLLRQIRSHNRKLLVELLVASQAQQGESSALMLDRMTLEEQLEERDTELELRDEMLLEKNAMLQYLATLGVRLTHQMESLGLEPCCALPESYQELAEAEKEDPHGVQAEKQRELEAQLQREQDEKAKMRRLLEAINTEREQGAAVLQQAEQRNRELRERENNATSALQELMERTIAKDMMREEAMRRTTHELMELQARLANQDNRRGSNVFERLLRSILD